MPLLRPALPYPVLLTLLMIASAAQAQQAAPPSRAPRPAADDPRPPPTSEGTSAQAGACRRKDAASLAVLACTLAQQLTEMATGASVRVVALKSDRELPAAEALRERVRLAVASALGSPDRPAQRSKLRVELAIEKRGGVLRVTAELRRATGLWQRVRQAKPSPEKQAFVEVPLDSELRALIPPPPLVVSETLKLKAPERGIVALACGPLGSEGAQELALVTRSSVRVGHIAQGTFVERKKASWSSLSPVAPAPLREPIASADITPQGTLRVGLSDRRDGVELTADFHVERRFEERLPLPGGGCASRDVLGLTATSTSCDAAAAPVRTNSAVDAVAGSGAWQLGRALGTSALVDLSGGKRDVPAVSHPGAQLALGDADSDGDPELAFSADTLEAAQDKLSVVSLQAGKVTTRFELPAPAIRAIAICSRREGPGMAPFVVATGDELWLLR